jgi:hypothetical protein
MNNILYDGSNSNSKARTDPKIAVCVIVACLAALSLHGRWATKTKGAV